MPKTRPAGMTSSASVDRTELFTLRSEVNALVDQETDDLQREVTLAEHLHAFLGEPPAPIPGDLAAKAISRFSRYVRFT